MLVLGNFLTMNPGKLVLVVIQMNYAAAWNFCKLADYVPFWFALHLNCANHIADKAAFQPFFYPF